MAEAPLAAVAEEKLGAAGENPPAAVAAAMTAAAGEAPRPRCPDLPRRCAAGQPAAKHASVVGVPLYLIKYPGSSGACTERLRLQRDKARSRKICTL